MLIFATVAVNGLKECSTDLNSWETEALNHTFWRKMCQKGVEQFEEDTTHPSSTRESIVAQTTDQRSMINAGKRCWQFRATSRTDWPHQKRQTRHSAGLSRLKAHIDTPTETDRTSWMRWCSSTPITRALYKLYRGSRCWPVARSTDHTHQVPVVSAMA